MICGILLQLTIICCLGEIYGVQQYDLVRYNYEISLNKNWNNHTRSNIMDMWDGQHGWLGVYSIKPDQIKPDEMEKSLLDTMYYSIDKDEHNKKIISCDPFENTTLIGMQYIAKSDKWIDSYFVLRSKNNDDIYFAFISKKLVEYANTRTQQMYYKEMTRNIVNSIQKKHECDKFFIDIKCLKIYLYSKVKSLMKFKVKVLKNEIINIQ